MSSDSRALAGAWPPLAIIGGGNMAGAILRGGLGTMLEARRVIVAEIDDAKRAGLAGLGVETVASAIEAMQRLTTLERKLGSIGQVLLAVKPQMLAGVAGEISGAMAGVERVVITILAGTPSEKVRAAMGGRVRVVRAMPNLPAGIRAGATAVSRGAGSCAGDEAFAMELFRAMGPVVVEIDESLMDAFTAVAGSGPAYVFYLAEAMEEAAVGMGFDREMARRVVAQTIAGAGAMLAESRHARAGWLRASVTSQGGTTEAAIEELSKRGVLGAIEGAMIAARDRGVELARER